jgi:large subunit ribosomal protein L13
MPAGFSCAYFYLSGFATISEDSIMATVQKTYTPKGADIEKKWYIIDAEGKVLGRLATRVADILCGKHKPTYAPHMDDGDFIIIINAEKVKLTGRKMEDKEYFHHTKHVGNERFTNIQKYFKEKPEFIIEHAVWGMLPKTRLGRKIFKNMKIYRGTEHPHAAQKPEKLEI